MRIYVDCVLETDADGFLSLFIAKKGRVKYLCFPQPDGRHAAVRIGTTQYNIINSGNANIAEMAKKPLDGLFYTGTVIEEKYMQAKETRINGIVFPLSHIYKK